MPPFTLALTGPESSGKSTLATALGTALKCSVVPEFARIYLEAYQKPYTKSDFLAMARGQALWMEHAKKNAKEELIVFDTDVLIFLVWSQKKYGIILPEVQQLFETYQSDAYVLCRPDIAWEADPLREHPDGRAELFQMYFELLLEAEIPFIVVEGSVAERVEACLGYLGI